MPRIKWKLDRARELLPLTRSSSPTSMVFFDVETTVLPSPGNAQSEEHYFKLAVACHVRFVKGEPVAETWGQFSKSADLAAWIVGRCHGNNLLWVCAHNLHYDFRHCGIVEGMKDLGLTWTKRPKPGENVDAPQPWGGEREIPGFSFERGATWFAMYHGKQKILWNDTYNWFRCSVAALGTAVGKEKGSYTESAGDVPSLLRYCRQDVDIIKTATVELVGWLRRESLGALKVTLPATALSVYRTKYLQEPIWLPAHDSRLVGQRESYYGGRVYTPFLGRVDGPVHHLDVNSLYPWAMANTLMPRDYLETKHCPTVRGTLRMAKKYALLGEVIVKSETEPYPVKSQGRTQWVVGEFRTWLPGPELIQACKDGHVAKIIRLRVFRKGDLFSGFVGDFYRLKAESRAKGDHLREMFYKLIMNSLYGKLAQWSGEYDYAEDLGWDDRFAGVQWYFPPHGEPVKEERWQGIVRRKVGKKEHPKSFPAIPAFVTSAARLLMRSLQRIAGEREWLYGDTDSLWTTKTGYARLTESSSVSSGTLGTLKLVGVHQSLTILGPKDYQVSCSTCFASGFGTVRSCAECNGTGYVQRSKGIRSSARLISPHDIETNGPDGSGSADRRHSREPAQFEQEQWEGLGNVWQSGWKGSTTVSLVKKTLRREYHAGLETASGWTLPFRLSLSLQEQLDREATTWADIQRHNTQQLSPGIPSDQGTPLVTVPSSRRKGRAASALVV